MRYLLLCRSLTYAQRSAAALERAGITATVVRAPHGVSARGCAYAVLVTPRAAGRAVETLKRAGLPPEKIFLRGEDGALREVEADDLA